VYIKLYVSETFETNSRSNAIYRKTLRTFVSTQYIKIEIVASLYIKILYSHDTQQVNSQF